MLVEDETSPVGYSVIGINTWLVGNRQNAFFALPSKNIEVVLEKTKQAEITKADAEAHKQSLEKTCKILAAELGSEHPDYNRVNRFISYAFVDECGLESFISVLKVSDSKETEKWETSFFLYSQIETIRTAIYILYWNTVKIEDEKSKVSFKQINYADEEAFFEKSHIRTIFLINGQEREIVWVFEKGK